MEKKEEKSQRFEVRFDLPTAPYRKYTDEEANEINLLTAEEALTEMYNDIKEIKKSLV